MGRGRKRNKRLPNTITRSSQLFKMNIYWTPLRTTPTTPQKAVGCSFPRQRALWTLLRSPIPFLFSRQVVAFTFFFLPNCGIFTTKGNAQNCLGVGDEWYYLWFGFVAVAPTDILRVSLPMVLRVTATLGPASNEDESAWECMGVGPVWPQTLVQLSSTLLRTRRFEHVHKSIRGRSRLIRCVWKRVRVLWSDLARYKRFVLIFNPTLTLTSTLNLTLVYEFGK